MNAIPFHDNKKGIVIILGGRNTEINKLILKRDLQWSLT